jgi:hypothetical protein
MTAEQVIENIEAIGGLLTVDGERIRYELPVEASRLLPDLQTHRDAVLYLLQAREAVPFMPKGVRLTKWEPKTPPIVLTHYAVVIDTHKFVKNTLLELDAALAGKCWLAGNRSVRELVERLEQVGIRVAVDERRYRSAVPGGAHG